MHILAICKQPHPSVVAIDASTKIAVSLSNKQELCKGCLRKLMFSWGPTIYTHTLACVFVTSAINISDAKFSK